MRWRNFHSLGLGRDLRDLTTELVGFDDNRFEEDSATSRTSASLVIVRENEEIQVAQDWILIILSSSTRRIQLTCSKNPIFQRFVYACVGSGRLRSHP